mgnify:CR=1 FL=1
MKKKIISTLLCTAMLATMVAGCGVEKSDGGSDTEGSASSVAEMKGTGDNEINILIYALKIAKFNSAIHLYSGILFCTSGV